MDQSNDLPAVTTNVSFESLKKLNRHGVEYWSARDLQNCLGYSNWRDFKNAIKKAVKSCEQSGNDPQNHFVDARKMVNIGSKADRSLEDYHLSRFACYLIAQNGDPRKPEIAQAQKYFAIQTRRQEILTAELLRRGGFKSGDDAENNMLFEHVCRPLAEIFEVSPDAMRIRLEGVRLLLRKKESLLFD